MERARVRGREKAWDFLTNYLGHVNVFSTLDKAARQSRKKKK